MATGTVFNPFITEDHRLTPASSKINEGNVHAKRVGNFIVVAGWFHMNSAGANNEVLFNWPSGLTPEAGGFATVASGSGVVAIGYTTTGITVYNSLAVAYWNFPTVSIPIS